MQHLDQIFDNFEVVIGVLAKEEATSTKVDQFNFVHVYPDHNSFLFAVGGVRGARLD